MGISFTPLPRPCSLCDFHAVNPCCIMDNYVACENFQISTKVKLSKQISESKIMSIGQPIPTTNWPREVYDTPRAKLLNEVMEIVHKDRNASYGNPEDNFSQIASLWTAYWQAKCKSRDQSPIHTAFDSQDVAIMNMLIKVARLAKNPNHHDSAVDIAGYAACLADVQELAKQSAFGSASA